MYPCKQRKEGPDNVRGLFVAANEDALRAMHFVSNARAVILLTGRRGVATLPDTGDSVVAMRVGPPRPMRGVLMARKLKTYQSSLGFFEQAIAAPDRKSVV